MKFLLKNGAYIDQTMLDMFAQKFSPQFSNQETQDECASVVEYARPFLAKPQLPAAPHDEKIDCFICMEDFEQKTIDIVPCHSNQRDSFVCDDCLDGIRTINNLCPLCRRELRRKEGNDAR